MSYLLYLHAIVVRNKKNFKWVLKTTLAPLLGGGLPFQRMLTHLDSTDKNTKKQNPQSTGNNIWTVELPSDNEW